MTLKYVSVLFPVGCFNLSCDLNTLAEHLGKQTPKRVGTECVNGK
jgi:hypothetical protein